jgi:hypothetical protein
MYRLLLDRAYALGLADGCSAADLEPGSTGSVVPPSCRGRSAAEFARLLWVDRSGSPPAGLEANAPLWYARGFIDGLDVRRSLGASRTLGAVVEPRAR